MQPAPLKSWQHLTNLGRISSSDSFMLMIWYLSEGRVFIILIMDTCVHKCRGAPGGQTRALHPRELELIGFCDCPNMGAENTTRLWLSVRAANALNHGASSPESVVFVCLFFTL